MPQRRTPPLLIITLILTACLSATPTPVPPVPNPQLPTPDPKIINLDSDTQALIASAERVVFIIPFSHWDTDWHDTYENYSKRSDGNILSAIELARQDSHFRYTLEQVLFVQHFWETHPEARDDLKRFIQNGQITFAWGGITQPDTSLVSPAIQVRNLQLGRQWIADTFGPEFVPHTAWQSDAFGNSAAFPLFLSNSNIPYLFIGRWQNRCDPDFQDCVPLPHLFHWQSPATSAKVLVAYLSYPNAWDAIHKLTDEDEQVEALRHYVNEQFARTESKFVFIPMGSDFIDPLPNVVSLVDRWNAANADTKLVLADPHTAFEVIATQALPTHIVDLNPIWQAFYATRPVAKITDKEIDYYLTANDKFAIAANAPQSSAWHDAALSAHYDNIGGVSFDWVWEASQRPRYEQTLEQSADDLAATLFTIAQGIESPLIIFNPASWDRTEVIEVSVSPEDERIPVGQPSAQNARAILVDAIPGIGWAAKIADAKTPAYPAAIVQEGDLTTLDNRLVSVTLDASRGGAISGLRVSNSPNLISTLADDITYWRDEGDVYGARFGDLLARESDTAVQVAILSEGPLLARAQVVFRLAGQTITKTVTLRADSPLVEVEVTLAALPNTSVIVHTHTSLNATQRTDDLGFATMSHEMDNTPIAPGDVTYRRKIFYPIMYWSDVADQNGSGLALLTHGLQALGGASDLNLLLVRDAREDPEGVTDTEPHTFRYAYLPHVTQVDNLPYIAYAFNHPLIPVIRSGDQINVQLPFTSARQFSVPLRLPFIDSLPVYPTTHRILSADSAIIVDVYPFEDRLNAVVIDYALDDAPATLTLGDQILTIPANSLSIQPITIK